MNFVNFSEFVDNDLQQYPNEDIYEDYKGYIHQPCQQAVDNDERYVNEDDCKHNETKPHPCPYKFMMDMILVWKERIMLSLHPEASDPDYIEHRYQQCGKSHNHITCRTDVANVVQCK